MNVASFVVFSKVYSVIISGIAFILVARLLGPSNYGIYTLALGAAGLFGSFGALNVGAYFNKNIPVLAMRKKNAEVESVLGNGIFLLLVIGVALSAIGMALGNFIAVTIFHNSASTLAVEIAMLSIVLSMLYSAVYSALISFGAGKRTALASITNNSFQAFMSIALVLAGFGAAGAVSGFVIGLFTATIVGALLLRKYSRIIITFEGIRRWGSEMLKFSSPLTGANIIGNLISNFAVVALGALFVPSIIGAYGVATKIGAFMDIIIGSISTVLVPMFAIAMAKSAISSKLEKFYNYSLYFGFLLSMPVIAYVVALAHPIISTVFSSSYHVAALYMSLVGLGLLAGIVASYSSSLIISMGYVNKVLKYAAVSGVLQLATILALMKAAGPVGIIIALYFVGNIASGVLYVNFISKKLHMRISAYLARLSVANLILFLLLLACGVLLSSVAGVVQMIIGFVIIIFIYPVLIAKIGAIGDEQIAILGKLGFGIPLFGRWLNAVVSYLKIFR